MEALLAGMAYTDACDQTDSYKYTKGVSMGPGFGDWGNSHAPGIRGVYRRFSI